MKFLADANISRAITNYLRQLGHDCSDGAAIPARLADIDVLRLANDQERAIVTADKDFGDLIYLHKLPAVGALLLRIDASDECARVAALGRLWVHVEPHLPGNFVIVTNRRVRVRPLPA